MSIFNSLGSNYDAAFVWNSLVLPGSKRKTRQLKEKLAQHYHGEAILTYKGRQALELGLRSCDLSADSTVGINGFTCYQVYQAVKRANYKPLLIDVAPQSLHFGLDELKNAVQTNPNLKAIVIQNTLGLVVDMPALAAYCKQHRIIIIEDLAHSLGAHYSDGQEAGTVGALTMLSFSQDKPLDVVAGGALIRHDSKAIEVPKRRVSLWQRDVNGLYPLWTALIRTTYPLGIGRYIHFGLKKLHLLATPMSDNIQGLYAMEPSAARFLLKRWDSRKQEIAHRQTIAAIYQKVLPRKIQITPLASSKPLYLRFPLWVDDRSSLVTYLKSRQIYIGDTWYDAPIAPLKYLDRTDYRNGSCPNAEQLAEHIVNLPTHMKISEQRARDIAQKVNQWLTSR